MKYFFIIILTVITLTACGQVTDLPTSTSTSSPTIATDANNLSEAPTPEPTTMVGSTGTQEEPTQDSTSPSFSKGSQILGDTRSFGLAVADVDMDNDLDILFANLIGQAMLWINDGNGYFSASSQMFGPTNGATHDVKIADLNGDSYPDIFVISQDDDNRIFFNDGAGVFTESEQSISENNNPQWLLLGDIDVDGDVDAIIMYMRSPNLLWLNDGSGFFTLSDTGYGGDSAIKMVMADFNGDTYSDLFHIKYNMPGDVWFNDGSGNFTVSGQSIGSEIGDDDIATGDIDGDGDQDIITASPDSGFFKVWFNQDGSGAFGEAGTYIQSGVVKINLLDADLDGDLDLITASFENTNSLWLNDSSGSYTYLGELFENKRVLSIGVADFDADGDDDIVFGYLDGLGGNRIYWND